MKVAIFGRGRLGSAIAQEVAAASDMELAWHIDKDEPVPGGVDLAFDASFADAVPEHLAWALETGTDLVIGVTGWTLPDLEARVGNRIAVLTSPNFSLAVALMARLSLVLGRFAADPGLNFTWHAAAVLCKKARQECVKAAGVGPLASTTNRLR